MSEAGRLPQQQLLLANHTALGTALFEPLTCGRLLLLFWLWWLFMLPLLMLPPAFRPRWDPW
jgi:hypothetical protein